MDHRCANDLTVLDLLKQKAAHYEPRNDEEQVDAEEAEGQVPEVKDDHHEDRDTATEVEGRNAPWIRQGPVQPREDPTATGLAHPGALGKWIT